MPLKARFDDLLEHNDLDAAKKLLYETDLQLDADCFLKLGAAYRKIAKSVEVEDFTDVRTAESYEHLAEILEGMGKELKEGKIDNSYGARKRV